MEQKNESKQQNWLVAVVVTTIINAVIQVFVNHFDSITAFLGGAFSQLHLSIDVAGVLNTTSAVITIGGAVTSPFIFIYMKRAKKRDRILKEVEKDITNFASLLEEHDKHWPPIKEALTPVKDIWTQMEKEPEKLFQIFDQSARSNA